MAMTMTRFCHSHILSDPNQALYKHCAYVTKSGLPNGQVICGRPIIKSAAPSLCNIHLQRSQKNIAQAYRKVGFNPSPTGKITPRFSVLIAECVRQIQDKRRQSLKCPKDEKVD
uniref:KANL2-like probable zinc-finger domain-containing protein n=1 Tax=Arundo donax TaxID=35708 RepID=A0A0A9EC42_ARUDO